jgi:hypothetical protein
VQGLLRALVPAPAISAQPLPTPPPPLTRSKSTQHLDSDRPVVELPWTGGGAEEGLGGQVVMAVEQAVFLGARRQEFKGVLPFMRMLHTIVHEHPWRVPVSAQLRASYGTIGLRFPSLAKPLDSHTRVEDMETFLVLLSIPHIMPSCMYVCVLLWL